MISSGSHKLDRIPLLFLPEKFSASQKNKYRSLLALDYDLQKKSSATVVKAKITKVDYVSLKSILAQTLKALVESFGLSETKWQNSNIEFDQSYFWHLWLCATKDGNIADNEARVPFPGQVFEEENQITIGKPAPGHLLLSQSDFRKTVIIAQSSAKSFVDIGMVKEDEIQQFGYSIHLEDYFSSSTSDDPISLVLSGRGKSYNFLLYPHVSDSATAAGGHAVEINEIIPQGNLSTLQGFDLDGTTIDKLIYQIDVLTIGRCL